MATPSSASYERNSAADESTGEDAFKDAEGDETDGDGAVEDVTERKCRGGRRWGTGIDVNGGGQRKVPVPLPKGRLDQILRALMQVVAATAKERTLSRTSLEKKAAMFFSGQLYALQNICKKPDERCLALFAYIVQLATQKDERLNVMLSITAETQRQVRRVSEEAAQRENKLLSICEESGDAILALRKQMSALDARLKGRDMEEEEHERRDAEPSKKKDEGESKRLAVLRANILDRLRKV